MNRTPLVLFAACAVVAAGTSSAQPSTAPPPPSRDVVLSSARYVVPKARYATMITVGEDGQPQARIVDPFEPEPDFTIWIGTISTSRKVAQLHKNSRVTPLLLRFDKPFLRDASRRRRSRRRPGPEGPSLEGCLAGLL
jgi:hypothetical protein